MYKGSMQEKVASDHHKRGLPQALNQRPLRFLKSMAGLFFNLLVIVTTPPISPESKSPRPQAVKRGNDNNGLNSSSTTGHHVLVSNSSIEASLSYSSSLIVESKSAKFESKIVPLDNDNSSSCLTTKTTEEDQKRCSFITVNSDPIYVAYHDQEWGVPVHDDNMLFELLVLSGAQVGSDWTSILKKRQDFRDAFSGFDAETAASFNDKQMMSISTQYDIDISRVRGVVDNADRILEIKRGFGSFEKYIWGFVNHKPISTQYKFGHKIPVKTSKSESISKDMVRRGFRFVGPTVVHSFMQASGLTNDHLISCHRHLPCTLLAARAPAV
ncbi:hypothetical protein JRO89_XS08G0025000 [Xanthoceras sorbifolium]|uniref:DNA-3-methyladenine glycosylase I n=1 Tax=Xanthoceras sorbifolium TaxID=99658 RepID=A0ABQ8HNC1_9ROSI|nr:hypothetical protein JRO89_XS08G0025000 [Xanthoceras sorbifolium]